MPLVSTVRLRERLSGGRSSLPWEFPEHRSEASLGGGSVAVRKAGMEGLTRVDGGCGICRRGIGCGSRGGSCGFPFHGFAQKSGQFQPYAFAEFMKGQRILYQILDESSHRGVPSIAHDDYLVEFQPLNGAGLELHNLGKLFRHQQVGSGLGLPARLQSRPLHRVPPFPCLPLPPFSSGG